MRRKKNHIILANPCEGVELSKKQRYESSYYSAEQLKTLFEAIKDDPIYPKKIFHKAKMEEKMSPNLF